MEATVWPPSERMWTVRTLGRLEIANAAGERPKFRSKSVQSLLAYLVLRPEEDVSKFVLEELFWPESDCDKQAQNLRRAIADLRDALESEADRGTVIVTKRNLVAVNPTRLAVDASQFRALSERGLKTCDMEALSEAISLYGGPLLAPLSDDWIYAYRLEYEERFAQCVEMLCGLKVAAGSVRDAVRIGRGAIMVAPLREDVHISLIAGYRSAGLEAEAIRQYEDLERMMDENWGETPSAAALEALEGGRPTPSSIVGLVVDRPEAMELESEATGGAMAPTSRFYVRRAADGEAETCIARQESVILLQGPRQVGKSSLLARLLSGARQRGETTVLTDFQTFGETQLVDEEKLYRTLAHSLARQLKVDLDLSKAWDAWLGPNMNLDSVLGELLARTEGHAVWAIDEADRLFGRSYANDIFGLLRSWHNRRALDPDGPWQKLTMVLTYAAEAHFFISDINQSPFNVGVRIPLRDFSMRDVEELGKKYEGMGPEHVDAVFEVAGGHPFLTRRAFAFLSQSGTPDELRSTASDADGPFGDHLSRLGASVLSDDGICEEVRNILSKALLAKSDSRYRLAAAGILAVTSEPGPTFRVPAYEPYLRNLLQ